VHGLERVGHCCCWYLPLHAVDATHDYHHVEYKYASALSQSTLQRDSVKSDTPVDGASDSPVATSTDSPTSTSDTEAPL